MKIEITYVAKIQKTQTFETNDPMWLKWFAADADFFRTDEEEELLWEHSIEEFVKEQLNDDDIEIIEAETNKVIEK